MKNLSDISILMISLDPALLDTQDSEVKTRHIKHAHGLRRLDIIVLAGANGDSHKLAGNCRVYAVGRGIGKIWRAHSLGRKLIKQYQHDLIDTQDPHWSGLVGLWLKNQFGRQLEVHFHGDFWHNPLWRQESLKHVFYDFLQNIIVRRADAIRVVSRPIRNKLVSSAIKSSKIRIINTPINAKDLSFEPDKQALQNIAKKYQNRKILLFVGRLVPAKNLFFLLDVISDLAKQRQDFVLLIIGTGPQTEALTKKIKEKKLTGDVFLLGAKNHYELVHYYRAAYLLLLLSTNESFGKVIVEAGFNALPTLASRTSGAISIIDDNQDGFLVDINSRRNTVRQISQLLDQKSLVESAGQKAKHDFRLRYSQQATFIAIKDFWLDIVNHKLKK